MCAFNLPTQYNASGQEYIKDDEEKVKIKLDPKKVQIDELTQLQTEEIVSGWIKYLNKTLQMNSDKVCIQKLISCHHFLKYILKLSSFEFFPNY